MIPKIVIKKNGFTLIELLVVISIIALLVAILMPALGKAKMMAQNAVCQSNMKTYGLAGSMYLFDNDGAFPYTGTTIFQRHSGTKLPVIWMCCQELPLFHDGKK